MRRRRSISSSLITSSASGRSGFARRRTPCHVGDEALHRLGNGKARSLSASTWTPSSSSTSEHPAWRAGRAELDDAQRCLLRGVAANRWGTRSAAVLNYAAAAPCCDVVRPRRSSEHTGRGWCRGERSCPWSDACRAAYAGDSVPSTSLYGRSPCPLELAAVMTLPRS